MKLVEIYNPPKRFAWFEPATNGGVNGVRLAILDPTMPRFNSQMEDAEEKHDDARRQRIALKKQNYAKQGEKTFANPPDLGWWTSRQEYNDGGNSKQGYTNRDINARYPELQIFDSREEAERAAKDAGVI